ncbi:MAG: hypothetical protein ABIS50_21390 [Luteolibacter sp.]|uniref:hypothetical protein n=1 Tax=Luteolibacter sp. TaxID=1962973 RepID=UPI0032666DA9
MDPSQPIADPSSPENSSAAPDPGDKKRTGKPTFVEDAVVTAFGFATSTAVAWLSWWMSTHWDFAVYTWMANFVIPVGAILCGFVAATGYWIGARVFNHRPNRWLLFNIVLVSLTTFFAIHHFHYSNDKVDGISVSRLMTYPDYLVQVTEHMTYKSSHSGDSDPGMELGKWGWGIAALQIAGFSFGGFAVYGLLVSVPYCDACAKYLSEKKSCKKKWKDPAQMQAAFESLSGLIREQNYQQAIDSFAGMGEQVRFGVKATLQLDKRKCPDCDNGRLSLSAMQRVGRKWTNVASTTVAIQQPLRMD